MGWPEWLFLFVVLFVLIGLPCGLTLLALRRFGGQRPILTVFLGGLGAVLVLGGLSLLLALVESVGRLLGPASDHVTDAWGPLAFFDLAPIQALVGLFVSLVTFAVVQLPKSRPR